MVAKFVTFFGLVAAAAAVAVPVAPVAKIAYAPVAKLAYAQPEAPAHYQFSYSVQDSHTGDVKQQQESRQGDAVHGSYSLVQPDGVHRIVEYTADEHQGFNAIVRYEGTPVHPAPAKIVAAAPVAKIAYAAAPVAKVAYAPAPVAKVAYAPAPVAYAAPAPVTYAHAPAPAAYAHAPAPVAYAHAPAPVAYAHAPAQVSYAHAPVAKLAYAAAPVAKVAYSQNLGQVSFSSPAVSYHH